MERRTNPKIKRIRGTKMNPPQDKNKSKKEFRAFCKCGHNHVVITGDNGINGDEERFELLNECCECNCERFRRTK